MAKFTPSRVSIQNEILHLLELISRRQGELSAHRRSVQHELRLEAIANIDSVHFSTKIEGNELSRDQVTQALESKGKIGVPARQLHEVLNYSRVRSQMIEWTKKGRPFNDEWILKHHSELLKGIVTGKLRGHYREDQCVIRDSKTRHIVYMAPEWEDVPPLMRGLLSWLRNQNTSGSSALILAGQFHFEFVTIHPFMDGNGRLARLLANGVLLAAGYDVSSFAAIEKQHERDRAAYYSAIRMHQAANYYDIPSAQDITPWIIYWLKCLLATYDEALTRLLGESESEIGSLADTEDDRLKKAESLFRRHQKLRASQYADLLGLGRTQAVADLNALMLAGVIERVGGGRSTIYRVRQTSSQTQKGRKKT